MPNRVVDEAMQAVTYAQIAVTGSSTTLAALINTANSVSTGIQNARTAVFQLELANVRWRDDGSAPTASIGMRFFPDVLYAWNGDLANLRLIREGGSNVTVNVTLYR